MYITWEGGRKRERERERESERETVFILSQYRLVT